MKSLKAITYSLAAIAMAGSFTSCSDDDPKFDDEGSKIDLPDARVYILNEGSMGMNNAGIAFYDPYNTKEMLPDLFLAQNGMRLGDVGQDMIEYRGYIYVSVYGSNYLAKLNAAGVEVKRKLFSSDKLLQAGIRYLAAEDGFIYASFYGGVIAKIDAETLEVKATLQTSGKNLEGVAAEDGKLYVANSYEIVNDPATGKNHYNYFTDLFVVDLRSFTLSNTVKVDPNPNMVAEEDDRIFVISNDYSQDSYSLQMVDPRNGNAVSKICYATNFACGNDMLYIVDSRTDYSVNPYVTTNTFKTYDIRSGRLNESSFLRNAPAELASASIYSMAVDEETGDIYLNVSHYSSANGDVYRFNRDGYFVEKFDCGGQNPKAMVFFD